jgi:hypothetical protein
MDVEGFEYDSFAKHNSIIRLVFLARTNLDGGSLGCEDGGRAVYVKNMYNSRTCLILWCALFNHGGYVIQQAKFLKVL